MLSVIAQQAADLGLPYEYHTWTSADVPNVYFTGEWDEESADPETGESSGRITLVGHSYNGAEPLWAWQEIIKRHYIGGVRTATASGQAYHLTYGGATEVSTQLEDFRRVEIYIDARQWR